jgi:CRISPR type III-A-associated protein Csm2
MNQYRYSSTFQGGRNAQDPAPVVADLWKDYLKDGYFDADGALRIEYVSREKVEPLVRAMCVDQVGLTTHQVRRYFGHCRAIETRLKASGAAWSKVWPEVKKLDIAAADGAAKQQPKIPALFHDFIRRNVAAIRTQKDFIEGFLPHFEALVGFGQEHFRKDRN